MFHYFMQLFHNAFLLNAIYLTQFLNHYLLRSYSRNDQDKIHHYLHHSFAIDSQAADYYY